MSETGIYIRVGKENVLLEDLNEIERTLWLESLSENGLIRTVNRCCDVIEDFIVNYQHLQQENQQLKEVLENLEQINNDKSNLIVEDMKELLKYKSVLDEIRDRATIRLARLENEPDYCKWFLEGYDRAITVNRASNSGVAMEWVKNTMITECKELLQILDKVNSDYNSENV